MHDVAQAAGVSLKTVSRVVNDEVGVRPATAAQVRGAIERLGFRPNVVARSLRRGAAASTVGLVIGDVSNPFYSAIARAVEDRAANEPHLLIIGSTEEDPRRERSLVATLLARGVEGLLIVPAGRDHATLAADLPADLPVVFLDRPPVGLDADAVLFDNAAGARAAVEWLLDRGHRQIAIVGDAPTMWTAQERHAGYVAALRGRGLEPDPALVRLHPHDADAAEKAMLGLLNGPRPPGAVFSTNNRMTIGVLHALRTTGARLDVVGFDDFETADLLGISTVAADPVDMGTRAADLLFGRLAGDHAPHRRIVLPATLVPREGPAGGRT